MVPMAASSGSFLITPGVGLMVWTLLLFGVSLALMAKFVFPRISDALDSRQRTIEESIDHAERMREESDKLLAEYRERLKEARTQADEIVTRARKAAEEQAREALEAARTHREELLEQTRRDVEAETRRAIGELRAEVADLAMLATEKITRKSLDSADQRRLIDEALGELDFSTLSGETR